MTPLPHGFHLLIKPVGPACNLVCDYCFYSGKENLVGTGLMADSVLETLTRQYIEGQDAREITFAWQGGEPALAGRTFFERALELQNKYASGKRIANTFQTNGTLLDAEWCRFFSSNDFLVGLSIDGPAELHDAWRRDKAGHGTFDRVMRAAELLSRHDVAFNTLTVVNRLNALDPVGVYRFLRDTVGARHMQFIPCVDPKNLPRPGGTLPFHQGSPFVRPGAAGSAVAEWATDPGDYGRFLTGIFDEWIAKDIGTVFVMLFEAALGAWMGMPAATCAFAGTCGGALALEHDGSAYSCDHFVYPDHRLGNIMERPLAEMLLSQPQYVFGQAKQSSLPGCCRNCPYLFACNGECPKNRFLLAPNGEPGLNYLCVGLKTYFAHIDPWMRLLAAELRAGRPASGIRSVAGNLPLFSALAGKTGVPVAAP